MPTGGDATPSDALFADIEAIDVSGPHGDEVNTLTLSAQDVIDATDEGNQLIVIGDNDILRFADPENWQDNDPSTAALDPVETDVSLAGSAETFDLYVAEVGDIMVNVLVDDDMTVQFETAMG